MSRKSVRMVALVAIVLTLAFAGASVAKGPPPDKPPGGETETAVNNLSFPAIAVDAFAISDVTESFTVPYTGDYPGLTADEIALVQANGPWYPQKTEGNTWNAEFAIQSAEDVTYIDWGDNVESVSPKLRAPFRLETTLYKALATPMTAYSMAVLEYPSSSNELQGTNTTTYEGDYATVVSGKPKLVVQYLGTSVPADLTWDETAWVKSDATVPSIAPVSFAPELNVGGKYVYGASQGGWKPTSAGYYRITFYVPSGSGVNLALGTIANASTDFTAPTEGKAFAVLEPGLNLTYIDVLVKAGGGGGKP